MAKEAAANATEALKRLNSMKNEEYSQQKLYTATLLPNKFIGLNQTHALIGKLTESKPGEHITINADANGDITDDIKAN